MLKINHRVIIGAAVMLSAFPLAGAAQTVETETAVSSVSFSDVASIAETVSAPMPEAIEPAPVTGLIQAIHEGKILLGKEKEKRLAIWGGKPPVYAEFPATAEIVLAVWRQGSQTVNLYLADKQGRNLRIKSSGAPPISVSHHARFYSRYAIAPEHQAVVVGVLYPIMDEVNGRFVTREEIYVPPTREMFNPEMYTIGSDYLSAVVQDAFEEIERRQIMSRTYPGRLLSEVIDPYLIKSIVVIEHSSHQQLLSENDPEAVLGAFYVNLAANGERAYSEAESTAKALGLAQFIPSTYALFVKNRPELGLIPDFRQGMADHQNAVIAEVAYFDDTLRLLPEAIRSQYMTNPALAADYLAAAYNGGVTRVKRAYTAFAESWDQYHGGTNSLRPETVTYVKKLRKVYAMITSGAFATPSNPSNAVPSTSTVASASGLSGGSVRLADANQIGMVCFDASGCVAVN